MIVYYLKNKNLKLPVKANERDAGFDVFASTPPKIVGDQITDGLYKRIEYIEYGTNLFVRPADKKSYVADSQGLWSTVKEQIYCIDARPRSSVSKYNLLLCNPPGTIDDPYRGEIRLRFKYILQPEDLCIWTDNHGFKFIAGKVNPKAIYAEGDKIVQLMASKVHEMQWIGVDELGESTRGDGGFGSTGT